MSRGTSQLAIGFGYCKNCRTLQMFQRRRTGLPLPPKKVAPSQARLLPQAPLKSLLLPPRMFHRAPNDCAQVYWDKLNLMLPLPHQPERIRPGPLKGALQRLGSLKTKVRHYSCTQSNHNPQDVSEPELGGDECDVDVDEGTDVEFEEGSDGGNDSGTLLLHAQSNCCTGDDFVAGPSRPKPKKRPATKKFKGNVQAHGKTPWTRPLPIRPSNTGKLRRYPAS